MDKKWKGVADNYILVFTEFLSSFHAIQLDGSTNSIARWSNKQILMCLMRMGCVGGGGLSPWIQP